MIEWSWCEKELIINLDLVDVNYMGDVELFY